MPSTLRYGLVARAALAGLAVGFGLALILLWVGNWGRGEAMESAAILAYFVAMPLSFVTETFDWGHYASEWVAFVVIVVPANWALLGAVVGILARAWRGRPAHV